MAFFVRRNYIERFEFTFDIDTELGPFFIFVGCGDISGFFWEVANVPETGEDFVVFAEESADGPRFGGGFDDYEGFWHGISVLLRGGGEEFRSNLLDLLVGVLIGLDVGASEMSPNFLIFWVLGEFFGFRDVGLFV